MTLAWLLALTFNVNDVCSGENGHAETLQVQALNHEAGFKERREERKKEPE